MLDYQEMLAIADEANLASNPIHKAHDILFYQWAFDYDTASMIVRRMADEGMLNEKRAN